MNNTFYKGQKQEHTVNDINTAVVVVGTEDITDFSYTYVRAEKNLESVVKLLSEAKSETKKSISISVTDENYTERYELARAYKAGLYFVNDTHIESLKGYSSLEIDEVAAQAGVLKNIKRFVASVARQVPFSLSRDQAVKLVGNAVSDLSFSVEKDENPLDLLNKAIDSDIIKYQHSRKIRLDSQIVGSFLNHRKPGPEASAELEAYAAKIFEKGGVHVLADGMGKGKTKHVIRKLIEAGIHSGEKSTVLTHRIAIARSCAIADLVEQYNDDSIKGREDQLKSLSLVINKCDNERFRVHTHQSGIIIIEEAAQVLRHLMQKGFTGDRIGVFHEILGLIKNARLVLFCEAFVNDILINYVRLAGRTINFMQGNADYSSINVCLGSVGSTQREILRALAANKKVLFSSDSRKQAETVAKIAKDQGKKVLLVTQVTKDNDEVVEFLVNPNDAILKYDILCHSPSIQSSVSITVKHFEAHFCIFGAIVGVDDAKQFVLRDRTAKGIVVGIHHTSNFAVEKKDAIASYFGSGDRTFDSIAFQQLHLNAREKNNFQQWLSVGFEQEGFGTSRLAIEKKADEEASKIFKSGKKAVKEGVTRGTLEARSEIKSNTMEKLEKTKSDKEYYLNNLVGVADATGKIFEEITEDDVKLYNEGAGISKIRNMKCLLLDIAGFEKFRERDKLMTGIDCGHYSEIREHLRSVMKLLINDNGVMTEECISEACEYIVNNQLDFKMNGLVSIKVEAKTDRQKHALISNFLSKLGLSKVRKMVDGARVYVLNNEQYERMYSYLFPLNNSSVENMACFFRHIVDYDEITALAALKADSSENNAESDVVI